jgi:hypothetical protein
VVVGNRTRLDDEQHLLRTGEEPQEAADGGRVAPESCLRFSELSDEDAGEDFKQCRAISFDWEQHSECKAHDVLLANARKTRPTTTHVYRIGVRFATMKITHAGNTIALEAWHWPEGGNDAHSHLVARPGVGVGTRKAVRAKIRMHMHPVFPTE